MMGLPIFNAVLSFTVGLWRIKELSKLPTTTGGRTQQLARSSTSESFRKSVYKFVRRQSTIITLEKRNSGSSPSPSRKTMSEPELEAAEVELRIDGT